MRTLKQRVAYFEYLASPEWQALRSKAIAFAQGRCQLCDSNNRINVHHRKYPEVLGQEPISDLIVLCRNCHELFHQKRTLPQAKIIMKGKITAKRKRYHLWVKSTEAGEVKALCNPSLVRNMSAVFIPNIGDVLCKVCKIHQ